MRKPKICGYGFRPSQTYSPKEIADRLGNAETTVREWIRDGKLPAMTNGKASQRANDGALPPWPS
jgi:excisionase family DNA binding protein